MIVEYVRYTIDGARAESFVAAYAEGAKSLRASSHCLAFELSRCTEAPDSFILRIDIAEMRHYEQTGVIFRRAT